MITGLSFSPRSRVLSQYLDLNITGAALLNGQKVVTTANGVHLLGLANSDNGTNIKACVKTLKTDFGQHVKKRVRTLFIRGRLDQLKVSLTADDRTLELDYRGVKQGFTQESGRVPGQRTQVGTYWQLEFKNKNGEDFSIDAVDVVLNTLSSRRYGG